MNGQTASDPTKMRTVAGVLIFLVLAYVAFKTLGGFFAGVWNVLVLFFWMSWKMVSIFWPLILIVVAVLLYRKLKSGKTN